MHFQVKVGTWNSVDRLSLAREEKDDGNMGEVHPMANKTFVITTVLVGCDICPPEALQSLVVRYKIHIYIITL